MSTLTQDVQPALTTAVYPMEPPSEVFDCENGQLAVFFAIAEQFKTNRQAQKMQEDPQEAAAKLALQNWLRDAARSGLTAKQIGDQVDAFIRSYPNCSLDMKNWLKEISDQAHTRAPAEWYDALRDGPNAFLDDYIGSIQAIEYQFDFEGWDKLGRNATYEQKVAFIKNWLNDARGMLPSYLYYAASKGLEDTQTKVGDFVKQMKLNIDNFGKDLMINANDRMGMSATNEMNKIDTSRRGILIQVEQCNALAKQLAQQTYNDK